MYAVIESGGKQYRVQAGDIIAVEKLAEDVGTSVQLNQVLLVSKPGDSAQIWLGKPLLTGASVQAEVVGQGRGEKVFTVKMKRRKGYRRTQGHRQELTQILITAVDNGSGENTSLSAADKKTRLDKFITSLTPKGPASSPKQMVSKKKKESPKKAS